MDEKKENKMRYIFCFLVFIASYPLQGNECLDKLVAGNKRFAKGNIVRQELVAAQYPSCAIVACSDSRVAPELIFDQDLGELFVVRLAGNVASKEAIESLDFAVNVLNVDIIVVLGHENCGAVRAVMDHKGDKELGEIAKSIENGVRKSPSLEKAIEANVQAQMRTIGNCPELKTQISEGEVTLVGGVYHMQTGLVTFLENE
jgi:carbonic anhydrase